MWQWRRGLPFFSLAANFPRQITLVRRPKDRAHRITKRGGRVGGDQIAEFPILSLAEIWNNNPHQGLATSVSFSIHWTMAGNGASPGAMKSAGGLFSSSDFHHDARFLSTSPYGMQLPGSRPVTEVPDASLDRFYLFIIILIGNVPAQQERRLLLPPRVFLPLWSRSF